MAKSSSAFKTISEVAENLNLPQHVLRFWETKFTSIKPMKRGGGRRYYRPEDIDILRKIRGLLYDDGYTIKGVQKIFREGGKAALSKAPTAADEAKIAPSDNMGDTRHELNSILSELEDIRTFMRG
jgi:DNA-binding transcriptional MerR regulator